MDNEIYTFGAIFIIKQAEQLQAEFEGVLRGDDIEYVHRMRVASRRLRTALRLFKDPLAKDHGDEWRKAVKGITRTLGKARDLDIQIQFVENNYQTEVNRRFKPGKKHLLQKLKEQRSEAQQEIKYVIKWLRESKILEQICLVLGSGQDQRSLPDAPALFSFASRAMIGALDEFINYQDLIYEPNNSGHLHAMRIAGKHFRYTMEIFNPIYGHALTPFIDSMKEIQDQLGEIHDCDVWISWLPQFIDQEHSRMKAFFGYKPLFNRLLPGIQQLIVDRKRTRQAQYDLFLAHWKTLIKRHWWENLRTIIEQDPSSEVKTRSAV